MGVSNKTWGSLTFGRQYAPAYDTLGDIFDPLTVGNYWQNSWMYNGIGPYLEVNNSVKYKGSFDGLDVNALYGFGNQPGAVGLGATYAVELTYTYGPAMLNAGFQQVSVPTSATGSSVGTSVGSLINGAKTNFLHISGAFQVTHDIRLLAGWLRGQDRTGLTDSYMQQSGAPTLKGAAPTVSTTPITSVRTGTPCLRCCSRSPTTTGRLAMLNCSTARSAGGESIGYRSRRILVHEAHGSLRDHGLRARHRRLLRRLPRRGQRPGRPDQHHWPDQSGGRGNRTSHDVLKTRSYPPTRTRVGCTGQRNSVSACALSR